MRYKLNGLLAERFFSTRATFGGKRDVFEAAGYPRALTASDYLDRYERQDIAQRVIEIYAEETWRGALELQENEETELSLFEQAWLDLVATQESEDGDTRPGITHYLQRADVVAGMGRYAVLLLGFADGQPLSEPVRPGSMAEGDLMYLSVYSEEQAGIAAYETDASNRRYGKPVGYNLKVTNGEKIDIRFAHWTRCVHVAEKPLTNDLLGQPRLRSIYNRLLDIEKIMAATGEGGWRLMNPSVIFATKDGYQLPNPDPSMPEDMRTALQAALDKQEGQIDELVHGLRRAVALEGLEPHWEDVQMSDPNGALDAYIKMVSAATGIPVRLLTGSERGELASSQDEKNWSNKINARRSIFAEPILVRPVVNRLRWAGVLPQPATGRYVCNWEPLLGDNPSEAVERADKAASALQKIGAQVDAKAFVAVYLPDLPEDAVSNEPEQPEQPEFEPELEPEQTSEDEQEAKVNAEFLRRWATYP